METLILSNKPFEEKIFSKKHNLYQNISCIVIPFSKILRSDKKLDIYSGVEKIPFRERDPDFKMILRQEFIELLNK